MIQSQPERINVNAPALKPQRARDKTGLLARVTVGKQPAPRRTLIYGLHGVGKSTFASHAPEPVFLDTEGGLNDLDAPRFPQLKTLIDFKACLRALHREEHDYKTVVIDSLDWLEPLMWAEVCEQHGEKSIESFGYGRGYVLALSHWRNILNGLDALRRDRSIAVVLVAHSKIERFESPDTESYDRYAPRLHKSASALVTEWCDEVLFATYKVFTKTLRERFNKERTQAIGTGERIMWTTERPCALAKNRLRLPEQINLDWDEYAKHFDWKGGES